MDAAALSSIFQLLALVALAFIFCGTFTTVQSAPFACNVPDPTHEPPAPLSNDAFLASYDFSQTTPVFNATSNVTCHTATYPYTKGLFLSTAQYNGDVDTVLPVKVEFNKQYNDSFLVIQWNTAFQCQGTDVSCRWKVVLNGKYSCDPTAFHDMYSSPSGDHKYRDTFTAVCTHWNFGGKSKIPAGVYNITIEQDSLNMFNGAQWIDPDRGTQPHGQLPTQYKGVPKLGDGYQASLQVREVQESPTVNVFHQKSVYQTSGIPSPITGARQFSFTKQSDASTTALKITWYDNFRCHTRPDVGYSLGVMDQCLFEVFIDGASCSPGSVRMNLNHNDHNNHMMGKTVMGVCTGIAAGSHDFEVRISGSGQSFLGMLSTTGTILIEEVPVSSVGSEIQVYTSGCSHSPYPSLSSPLCFPSTEPDRSCILACRTFTINKPTATSAIKFNMYDNFGCDDDCDIEIRIDGMSCTDPGVLKLDHIKDPNLVEYYGGIGYVGFCREWNGAPLSAGSHTVRLFRYTLSQNPAAASCAGCNSNNIIPTIGSSVTGFMEVSYMEPEVESKCY